MPTRYIAIVVFFDLHIIVLSYLFLFLCLSFTISKSTNKPPMPTNNSHDVKSSLFKIHFNIAFMLVVGENMFDAWVTSPLITTLIIINWACGRRFLNNQTFCTPKFYDYLEQMLSNHIRALGESYLSRYTKAFNFWDWI